MFLNFPRSAVLKRLLFLYLSHNWVTAMGTEQQRGRAVMDGREEM